MTLLSAPERTRLLLGDRGDDGPALSAVGLHAGDEAVVVARGPFGGPLLVDLPTLGVRVVIGRGRAARIEVRPFES